MLKYYLMEFIYILLSVLGGYFACNITTTPGSRVNKKLPTLKIKRVQILPTLQVTIKGRIFHIHHWFFLTILLCISFVGVGFIESWTVRGLMMGGVLQGLKFPDRGIIKKIPDENLGR